MDKLPKYFLFICAIALNTFFSCEKDTGNGDILCTVQNSGKPAVQVRVYLKYGVNQKPGEKRSFSDYDRVATTDAYGQVYFDNLPPQNYYLLLTGHDPITNELFLRDTLLQIRERFRENEYDVVIEIN